MVRGVVRVETNVVREKKEIKRPRKQPNEVGVKQHDKERKKWEHGGQKEARDTVPPHTAGKHSASAVPVAFNSSQNC